MSVRGKEEVQPRGSYGLLLKRKAGEQTSLSRKRNSFEYAGDILAGEHLFEDALACYDVALEIAEKDNSPLGSVKYTVLLNKRENVARAHPSLESRSTSTEAFLAVGLLGLVASTFFISNSATGNSVGNLGNVSSGWIGIVFAVLGFGGIFLWAKQKRN